MLKQLRKDVEMAKQLPDSVGEYTTGNQLLLIELTDGVVCYQLENDKIIRRKLVDTQKDNSMETAVWSVPQAKINWQVWRKQGRGYALEIKTYIEQNTRGHWQKKMANSHLYFAGGFQKMLK